LLEIICPQITQIPADFFFRLNICPQIMLIDGDYLSADYADFRRFFLKLKTLNKSFVFKGFISKIA